MKCHKCGYEMIQDKFGYNCDGCRRYFTNMIIEIEEEYRKQMKLNKYRFMSRRLNEEVTI